MTDSRPAYLLPDGLDASFWEGLRKEQIVLQHCRSCLTYQRGPEYVCYRCGADNPTWAEVPTEEDGRYGGLIYSWERVWHPADASLVSAVPYVVVLVELPAADNVRLIGNLVDPPEALIPIGAKVVPVFEHHDSHTLSLATGLLRLTTAQREWASATLWLATESVPDDEAVTFTR